MSNPDIVYYNCNSICVKTSPTDADQPCVFQESRPYPILSNASDYKFSLIRATIDSTNIPCFIPKIITAPNVTAYQIKTLFNYTGSSGPISNIVTLDYTSRSKYSLPIPSSFDYSNKYYWVYDIQDFIDMFNSACATSFINLQNTLGVAHTITTQPPKMIINNNNLEIYYDAFGFGFDATGDEQCFMYINEDLKNLIRNFNCLYSASGDGLNYQLIVSNKLYNNQTVNSKLYYVESQSFSSLSTVFSPVSSIVFISNMGIRTEYAGNVQRLSNASGGVQSSDNIENQIIDIALSVSNPMDYSTQIEYVASVFRFSDILTNEIRNIDISVFWKNKYTGQNYNVLLSDGCSFNAKLMFQKKD